MKFIDTLMRSMLVGVICAWLWYCCRTGGLTDPSVSYAPFLYESSIVLIFSWPLAFIVIWFFFKPKSKTQ